MELENQLNSFYRRLNEVKNDSIMKKNPKEREGMYKEKKKEEAEKAAKLKEEAELNKNS